MVDDLSHCLLSLEVQLYMRSVSISPNYSLLESNFRQNILLQISLPVIMEFDLISFPMIRTQSIILVY